MKFIWYFIQISLYPLAAILVCGLAVWACRHLFMKLLGRSGYNAVMASGIIGTPIHELGHAAMCLLFRHEIVELVLWQPYSDDGRLGYVLHNWDRSKPVQRLGNLFIGAGPIFSGMAVLSLLMALAFPDTWRAYFSDLSALVRDDASVPAIVFTGLGMIPRMIAELFSEIGPILLRIPALLVLLAVSLHIELSPADIKNMTNALPLYLMITLAIAVVTFVFGSTVTGLVLGGLRAYHTFMMAMFTVVLVFAAVQVALALLIRWLLSRMGR